MTLEEMIKKTLTMIEEIDPNSPSLTADPDIEAKMPHVINQVMYELARIKKIPDYAEIEVHAGDLIRFDDIANVNGYEVYQIDTVHGASHEMKAQGTIIKVLESGTLEIDYFRYPERITEKTKGNYEFELSADVLEIMPYGVAADLLKSDVSTEYGVVYSKRFEEMLQRLDTRYNMGTFTIEGGVMI
jgi:hypothetical protein